jgi:hypothetical protein
MSELFLEDPNAYNDLLVRLGTTNELSANEQIATALLNKGF